MRSDVIGDFQEPYGAVLAGDIDRSPLIDSRVGKIARGCCCAAPPRQAILPTLPTHAVYA
jgi:hypothetical protein